MNNNSLNEQIVTNVPLFTNEAMINVVKFVHDNSVDQVIGNLSPDNLASHLIAEQEPDQVQGKVTFIQTLAV